MTEYPPFSGHGIRCPKCAGEVSSDYQPAGTRFVSALSSGFLAGYGDTDEWLLRICASCNYSWPESCADAHVDTIFGEGP